MAAKEERERERRERERHRRDKDEASDRPAAASNIFKS